jgi:hypothetical protein
MYIENIVTPKEEEPHSGMKKFWTYIKHKRKDNIGISSLKMDGKLFCDPGDAGTCYSWLCKVDYLSPCSNLMPVRVTRGFVWSTTLFRALI